jgi:hypothetical protein
LATLPSTVVRQVIELQVLVSAMIVPPAQR